MKCKFIRTVFVAMISFLCVNTAQTSPIAYTDSASFFNDLTATGLTTNTLDFDSLSNGLIIASGSVVENIIFDYNFGGVQLMVSDIYDTTSQPNFLGTDDADVLQDGDDFNLSFIASHAIGLYFITADLMFDNDIMLTTGGITSSLIATDIQETLTDGANVYFLGIIDETNTFTDSSITTIGGGNFLYNVDDIIISEKILEPSFIILFLAGLPGFFFSRKIKYK